MTGAQHPCVQHTVEYVHPKHLHHLRFRWHDDDDDSDSDDDDGDNDVDDDDQANMMILTVICNPEHFPLILKLSPEWIVKIWDKDSTKPLFMFDLNSQVMIMVITIILNDYGYNPNFK